MTYRFREYRKKRGEYVKHACAFLIFLNVFYLPAAAKGNLSFFDSAIVNDTIIRLGDIAAVSGTTEGIAKDVLAQIPIGEAAPAGYSRFVNIDDVFRYCLHPRKVRCLDEYRHDKRLLVKTAFQEISLAAYEKDIVDYISQRVGWTPGDYQIKIININEKWRCLKQPFSISFEGLSSKYPRGNFICKLIVQQGSKQIQVPIKCFLSITTPVVVSSVKMQRGTPLSFENCHMEKMDITHFRYMPYVKMSDIETRVISRSINAGTIIHEKMAVPVSLVKRDEMVQLVVIRGKIRACIIARARESGALGNTILVENEMTHKLFKAKIIRQGQVVLSQGDGDI